MSGFVLFQHIAQYIPEKLYRIEGLVESIARSAHLKQHTAGADVLIETGLTDIDGPHNSRIA